MKTPPPGAAQSPPQSLSIIPENLIELLNNTENEASTVVQHARLQHKSPEKVVHHKVVKPQAATTHQMNADGQQKSQTTSRDYFCRTKISISSSS